MSTAVLVDYIDEHRVRFGVEPICRVLREAGLAIAPSTYYGLFP
ncbi:putative transposase, partial [Mobilicoccus pelagius NBRC 104925]